MQLWNPVLVGNRVGLDFLLDQFIGVQGIMGLGVSYWSGWFCICMPLGGYCALILFIRQRASVQ